MYSPGCSKLLDDLDDTTLAEVSRNLLYSNQTAILFVRTHRTALAVTGGIAPPLPGTVVSCCSPFIAISPPFAQEALAEAWSGQDLELPSRLRWAAASVVQPLSATGTGRGTLAPDHVQYLEDLSSFIVCSGQLEQIRDSFLQHHMTVRSIFLLLPRRVGEGGGRGGGMG